MMKPPRLGLIILILSLVFAGTYFIANVLKHSGKPTGSAQQLPSIKLSSLKPAPFSSENFDEKNNLTESLSKNVFEEIKKQTETNPDFFSSLPDVNTISQKILEDSLRNNSFDLDQPINEADLKISQDNSREAKIRYLKEIEQITQNRFNNSKYIKFITTPAQITEAFESDCFGDGTSPLNSELTVLYKNLANDYLILNVPSDWLDFHKQSISHFQKANLVYLALANCSKDMIKAYLAVQEISPLIEKAQEIQNSLIQKYKEIGL